MKLRIYLLIATLVLLSLARFYQLDFGSYWLDELVSVNNGDLGFAHSWKSRSTDYNPPGYDWILVPIVNLWGPMEFEGRLLSALAGSVSLAFLFLFFWRMRQFWAGVLVVLAAGLSHTHYHYSREARPYIFIFLFSLLALIHLQKKWLSQKPWTLKDFGILSLILALGNYFHYCGVIFTAAFLMALVLFRKHFQLNFKQIFSLGILQALLYLPWMEVLLKHSKEKPGWIGKSSEPIYRTFNNLSDFYFGHAGWGPLIFLFLASVLVWAFRTKHPQRWLLALTNSLWILPVLITLFILVILTPGRVFQRHLIEFFPGLLLSLFLSFTIAAQKFPKITYFFICSLVAFQAYNLFTRSPLLDNLYKVQDRQISDYIARIVTPCQLILTDGFAISQIFYMEKVQEKPVYRIYETWNSKLEDVKAEPCEHVIFIKTGFFFATPPEFATYLQNDFEKKSVREFYYTEVFLLERKTK